MQSKLIGLPDIDEGRAREIIEGIRRETTKWLFGLDEAIGVLVKAAVTLIPYSDSLTSTKKLKQPNGLIFGGTGVGKTDMCNSLFSSIGGQFQRIQGEPSLMPDDIIGYDTLVENLDGTREIKFIPGPLLAHGILFDEGNRTPGRTKAALIEAGEESAVTLKSPHRGQKRIPVFPVSGDINDVTGSRYCLYLTTQNVFGVEEGTFPNPMAELDRYAFSMFLWDPDNEDDEDRIRTENVVGKKIERVATLEEVLAVAHLIYNGVTIPEHTQKYMTRLIRNTRPHRVLGGASEIVKKSVAVGASPRVRFHLEAFVRTETFFCGDSVATIDHVKRVAEMVLAHRLVLQDGVVEINKSTEEICREIIREVIKQTDLLPWS